MMCGVLAAMGCRLEKGPSDKVGGKACSKPVIRGGPGRRDGKTYFTENIGIVRNVFEEVLGSIWK